jgi:hypothetical protein
VPSLMLTEALVIGSPKGRWYPMLGSDRDTRANTAVSWGDIKLVTNNLESDWGNLMPVTSFSQPLSRHPAASKQVRRLFFIRI